MKPSHDRVISKAVLQIIRGNRDDSEKKFSYFSTKTYVVTLHKNRLVETVLMMDHNICLMEIEGKSSLNYPFFSFLFGALMQS